jgi:predicted Zn-dependent protease
MLQPASPQGPRMPIRRRQRLLQFVWMIAWPTHRDLAWILDNSEFDWAGAEREYRRALELNPGDARALHWCAQHRVALGKTQDALHEAKLGLELDPLSEGSNYNYAPILIYNGMSDAAIDHLKGELLREPNSEVVYGYLGIAYSRKHDYADAILASRSWQFCR